jgi:coenzyme F420 hydrogenase subunit beta
MRRLRSFTDVAAWRLCVGCGACVYACKSSGGRMVHVETEGFRPVFDTPNQAEMTAALPVCPGYQVDVRPPISPDVQSSSPESEYGTVLEIWEGWATDPEVRFRGSSGGILTALSMYLLEVEGLRGILHAGMDPDTPWMNRNYVSRNRADVLARAGSRYAPSAPCEGLDAMANDDGVYAFVGKPCDVSAIAELRRRDPQLDRRMGLVLSFFCAGTPSARGTLNLMAHLGTRPEDATAVHYRGNGWPGRFRMTLRTQPHAPSLSYDESWSRLTSYRPLRCHLCPDGLGRLADIACGDAWDEFKDDGDPGRSLILVRSERGRRSLHAAARAGYVTLIPGRPSRVFSAQQNLLQRRRELFGRLFAFRMLGLPVPSFKGFSLLRAWLHVGLHQRMTTISGTLRRIVRHAWYRRRRALPADAHTRVAEPSAHAREAG